MDRLHFAEPRSRRWVLAGGLVSLFPLSGTFAAPVPDALAFAALRNGHKIGEQHMTFQQSEGVTVRTEVEMAVKLGPIALYRYRHVATERWHGDRFESLDTRTSDNGNTLRVSARREDDRVTILPAAGGALQAAKDALPFTHWNRAIARAPLFNPQDGKLLRETVTPAVKRSILLADGSSRPAEGIEFRGDAYIDDWYGGDGAWIGLTGRLKDGSTLEYRRL